MTDKALLIGGDVFSTKLCLLVFFFFNYVLCFFSCLLGFLGLFLCFF